MCCMTPVPFLTCSPLLSCRCHASAQNNTFYLLGEKAGPTEVAAGQLMRKALVDIATVGQTSVLAPLIVSSNATNIIVETSTAGQLGAAAQIEARTQWKQHLCSALYNLGFDERFWWIN